MAEQEGRTTTRAGAFDDLAKGLATGGVSRRKALRMLGAALVGGVLASVPGVAWAARPGGRQGCPIVGQVRVRGKCTCEEVGTTPCGGQCVSTTCPSGQDYDFGSCECVCAFTPCPEGQFYNFGTCQCAPVGQCTVAGQCSAGGVFPSCAPAPFDCLCVGSVEGAATCAAGGFRCEDFPPCESTAECEAQFGSGYFCQAPGSGCCGQICVPPCGAGTTTLGASSTGKTNAG